MYNELKYWYLRDHKLFWTLSMSQIKQLCIITDFKTAKKGDLIQFSSSDLPMIYLLKKGKLKIVSIDMEGNETIKEIISKGDLFGELSLEYDKNINEYAKVLSDEVSICSFLISDFEELLTKNPALSLTYIKFIGFKLKRLKNNYSNLISKDAKTRLATFLIEWATKEGENKGEKVLIDNYLTQNDIAQLICTSRQTTALLLNDLKEKNIINYSRNQIIINDISKLKSYFT